MYNNQERIKNILSPIKAVNSHYESSDKNTINLSIGNILSLPIEILHIEYKKNTTFAPSEKTILRPRTYPSPPDYKRISFHNPERNLPEDFNIDDCKIIYKILGASKDRSDSIFKWPSPDRKYLTDIIFDGQKTIGSFDFVSFDKKSQSYIVNNGSWTIEEDLIIPKDYRLIIAGGTKLNLINSSKIISFSPISFQGSEEKMIIITSDDSSGQGLAVLQGRRTFILGVCYI